jgi:voltage-gated potassium channel
MANEPPDSPFLRIVRTRVRRKGLRPRLAAGVIAILWLIAIVAFGTAVHLVDRESFDNVWLGMWWATQTVTTVGYGDAVPAQTGGQILGAVLMIGGLSLFAVVTGAITSLFVAAAQRQELPGIEDPVMDRLEELTAEVRALRDQVEGQR